MNLLPIFLPIPSFPNYCINPEGTRVINTRTGNLIKIMDNNGYCYVSISKVPGGNNSLKPVHELVAETYLKEEKKRYVWLLDGVKNNCDKSNLMYCDVRQYILYNERKPNKKKLDRKARRSRSRRMRGVNNPKFAGYYHINGKRYPSSYIAAKALKVTSKTIIQRCHSESKRFGTYIFQPV